VHHRRDNTSPFCLPQYIQVRKLNLNSFGVKVCTVYTRNCNQRHFHGFHEFDIKRRLLRLLVNGTSGNERKMMLTVLREAVLQNSQRGASQPPLTFLHGELALAYAGWLLV
jgi:hypothetical protein